MYKTRDPKDWKIYKEAGKAFKTLHRRSKRKCSYMYSFYCQLKQYISQLDYTKYLAKTVQPK